MTMIYLASPIDQAGGAADQLRQEAARLLTAAPGTWLYDPASAFRIGDDVTPERRLTLINRRALYLSDGVLALMPPGVPTVGTPMEAQEAIGVGKPVAIVGGDGWHLEVSTGNSRRFTVEDVDDAAVWLNYAARRAPARRSGVAASPMYVQVGENGRMPTRAYPGDAGYDLYVSDTVTLAPGEFADVPCDVRIELPDLRWAMLVGRSSSIRKRGLLVYQGIIDNGYRGDLYAGCLNVTDRPVTLEPGERIAQLIPMPLLSEQVNPVRVDQLSQSERSAAGFGSSGA